MDLLVLMQSVIARNEKFTEVVDFDYTYINWENVSNWRVSPEETVRHWLFLLGLTQGLRQDTRHRLG